MDAIQAMHGRRAIREAEVATILGHPAEQPAGHPRPRPQIHWLMAAAGT